MSFVNMYSELSTSLRISYKTDSQWNIISFIFFSKTSYFGVIVCFIEGIEQI